MPFFVNCSLIMQGDTKLKICPMLFLTRVCIRYVVHGRAPTDRRLGRKTPSINLPKPPTSTSLELGAFTSITMTYRCQYCSGLSVQGLVRLAKQEFTGHWFPTSAYYQHHGSLHDLEESAHAGCDLCLLILNCLKGMPWTEGKRMTHSYFTWEQADLSIYESAYTVAKELDVSDVKLCISTDHVYNGETLEKVRAFTTLLVQIGPPEVPEPSEYFEFPYLTLSLNAQGNAQ